MATKIKAKAKQVKLAPLTIRALTSWSYSRYADYKQCPRKAKHKYIDKMAEPGNDAMRRGSDMHKSLELYIKGGIRTLPADLRSAFPDEVKAMRKAYAAMLKHPTDTTSIQVEMSLGFTKDWVQCSTTDWDNCWLRIKIDVGQVTGDKTVTATDWKSGRYRPDEQLAYEEQMELYAIGVFITMPDVDTVIPRLGYVDHNIWHKPRPAGYLRQELPELKAKWKKRVAPFFADKVFAPRPNDRCNWCAFSAAKGGPCKF